MGMQERLEEWIKLVDLCRQKPKRKSVHGLRVVTLRLQAELDFELTELPKASHQARAIMKFNKLGEKLRKVLGPVRELDVWVDKLEGLRGALTEHAGYVPESAQECTRQIEKLESRIGKRRRRFGKKLVAVLEKRQDDFADCVNRIESESDRGEQENNSEVFATIAERFTEVVRDFPTFNEENLHEFRKRIKLLRYLAEIHGSDIRCAQLAEQVKKVQSAIGEWHDWQEMSLDVRQSQPGKSKELVETLDAITAESFETALSTSHSVTAILLAAESESNGVVPGASPKMPMRSDDPVMEAENRRLA